jgi:hypothetical protein
MSIGPVTNESASSQTNSNVICFESRRKGAEPRRPRKGSGPRRSEAGLAAELARKSYEQFVADLAVQQAQSVTVQGSNVISLLQARLRRKAEEEEALQSMIRELCS